MLRRALAAYPRQFWLLFAGMFVSTSGTSMVWPFLMIYMSGKLGLSRTAAASLMSINAGVALLSAFVAGLLVDRLGRKWTMSASLMAFGGVYLLYGEVQSYGFAALLMGLSGLVNPLYRVGADAMLADLIPPDERVSAYSLMRMSSNLGISIGPVIGGFLAATSYNTVFLLAASGLALFGALVALFARETLPARAVDGLPRAVDGLPRAVDGLPRAEGGSPRPVEGLPQPVDGLPQPVDGLPRTIAPAGSPTGDPPARRSLDLGGYAVVFADRPFTAFIAAFTLAQVCAALIWVLMPVHANQLFGVPENQYGWIPMTNALIVVLLQALVTRAARPRPPLRVLALGALFYAAAVASVALARGWSGFWFSMVLMTFGELLLVPTSTTYTANLAPTHMRGRYMSIYGLTWNVAQGLGPLAGGFLSDTVSPAAPWLMGGVAGLTAVAAFTLLAARQRWTGKALARED